MNVLELAATALAQNPCEATIFEAATQLPAGLTLVFASVKGERRIAVVDTKQLELISVPIGMLISSEAKSNRLPLIIQMMGDKCAAEGELSPMDALHFANWTTQFTRRANKKGGKIVAVTIEKTEDNKALVGHGFA